MVKKIMIIDEYKCVNYAGGIEKVICNFANEFTKRGYEVSIVCLDTEKGKPLFYLNSYVDFINLAYKYSKYTGVEYYLAKIWKEIKKVIKGKNCISDRGIYEDPRKRYFYSQFIYRLKKLLSEIRPDCIICVSADSTYIAQQANKDYIPIIMMCHMNTEIIVKESLDYQRLAWRNASAVQTLFPSYARVMRNAGANNVVTIPNIVYCVDSDNIAKLHKDKNIYRIITVGRIERTLKRTILLVEAFCKIAHKYENWILDIYGEIDNRNYIKEINYLIEKNNLQGRIKLYGKTNDVVSKLKEADIFAFPSKSEGFPLAMTEAMAVGLPVVAYKSCSGVNEIVVNGKTGFLVEDGIDDFADKLEYLMNHKDLRVEMGEEARKSILKYAPDIVFDQWEDLLISILSEEKSNNSIVYKESE